LELWAWASEDIRVVGFAPFHFSDEPSYAPEMSIGFRNLPETLSFWTEIGLKIKHAVPEAKTLRERLAASVKIGAAAMKIDDDADDDADGARTKPVHRSGENLSIRRLEASGSSKTRLQLGNGGTCD
jgi:hypothetical protein